MAYAITFFISNTSGYIALVRTDDPHQPINPSTHQLINHPYVAGGDTKATA